MGGECGATFALSVESVEHKENLLSAPWLEKKDLPADLLTRASEQAAQRNDELAVARQKAIEDAETIDPSATPARIAEVMRAMHACHLDQMDIDRALTAMRNRTKVLAATLRETFERLRPAPVRRSFDGVDVTTLEGRDLWDFLGLDQNDAGTQVLDNLNNAVKVLEADSRLRGHIWFDEFANRVRTDLRYDDVMDFSPGPGREWCDIDDFNLTQHMQGKIGMAYVRTETVAQAVRVVAMRNRVNPPRDWLNALEWDGVERLPLLLHRGFGTELNDYTRAVGRCFFVSMVARVLTPGCQVDTVPVFEGPQGAGKSRALRIIGGRWYSECHEPVTSKDFYLVLDGQMLVELSELTSFSKAEANRIKGVISCSKDRYRAPYERHATDHLRQTVLAGSTNQDDWNADETGARRFWPVKCTTIDHGWLLEHRDQLFAEAVVRFVRREQWHDVPVSDARAAQAERRPDDVWTEYVREYIETGRRLRTGTEAGAGWRGDRARIDDILVHALGVAIEDQGKADEMRVASILTGLGWRKTLISEGGKRYRFWIPGEPSKIQRERTTATHGDSLDFSSAPTV